MIKQLSPLVAALLLAACAAQPPAPTATGSAETANKAIAAAEASVKKADGVGFAWRDSEKLIADAKEAVKKEDYATAEKLAKNAEKQGQLAYQQYEDQKAAVQR